MTKKYVKNTPPVNPHIKGGAPAGVVSTDGWGVPVGATAPLPCLFSNNSTEQQNQADTDRLECVATVATFLSPYHKRVAQTLFANVERLIQKAPSTGHVAFFTITFPDNVEDHREAYRRFRSFNSHFLSPHPDLGEWVCTKERQKRGAWHYHMIIQTTHDIRSGVDFASFAKGDYSTATPFLRDLWQQIREAAPKYDLGRCELVPIKSNAEAMGRYVGKYISKHMGKRDDRDKGVRLVNYSRGWTRNSVCFAWYNQNSQKWRRKLALFAQFHGCTEFYQLNDKLGSGWAFRYSQEIMDIDLTLIESEGVCCPDHQDETLSRITENQKRRQAAEHESPNLIRRKTQNRIDREKAKTRVAALLTQDYQPPEVLPEVDTLGIDLVREWAAKHNPEREQQQPMEVPF